MANGTVDLTKFKKHLTDKLGIPIGFSDPKIWLDTGNYALNRLISGDYRNGVPLGKVTMFAGESGSGKSLMAANVMRAAQKRDDEPFILLLDSEGAGDMQWYRNAGVDPEKNFLRAPVFTVGDCTAVVASFVKEVVSEQPERPFLIVMDSLGMLETDSGQENFMKGEAKGDQGQLAKQLKRFVKNCVYLIEQKNVGFLMTNHTYDSQDMFNPDQKVSGGNGIVYASSIVIATRKAKLKEVAGDKEYDATSTGVHGIKINAMVYKSRFAKPFEKTTVEVPWTGGVDKYSGLLDLFEADGTITKTGNKLQYIDLEGNEHKYFRKSFPRELMDQIMLERPYELARDDLAAITEREREISQADELEDNGEE